MMCHVIGMSNEFRYDTNNSNGGLYYNPVIKEIVYNKGFNTNVLSQSSAKESKKTNNISYNNQVVINSNYIIAKINNKL